MPYQRCSATTNAGTLCQAPAVGKDGFCFFHDPAREPERAAARAKGRQSQNIRHVVLRVPGDFGTIDGVIGMLEIVANELLENPQLDMIRRANALAQLGKTLLYAIELRDMKAEIYERLRKFEQMEADGLNAAFVRINVEPSKDHEEDSRLQGA